MAIKVTLRKKGISKNRDSLYLDFYPAIINQETGKETRRQFLKMYVHKKPKTAIEKAHNRSTLEIAQALRLKRENELNKPEIYSEEETQRLKKIKAGEECFVMYFEALANKRRSSTHDNWMSALNYLRTYTGGSIRFKELSVEQLERFKEFLLSAPSKRSPKSKLAVNSAVSYFNKVRAALKQSYKEGKLSDDLNSRIVGIQAKESNRDYLTLEELQKLIETPCNSIPHKKAALFSAMTGMAFKEIMNLKWGDISYQKNEGYTIRTRRQKTDKDNDLPVSDSAYSLLNGSQDPKMMPQADSCIQGLKYSAYHNKDLYQWIGAAGITKPITFHCFRHTFATIQLSKGTDIYTLSKLLGHKNVSTTAIYTKVVDAVKRKAAERMEMDFKRMK